MSVRRPGEQRTAVFHAEMEHRRGDWQVLLDIQKEDLAQKKSRPSVNDESSLCLLLCAALERRRGEGLRVSTLKSFERWRKKTNSAIAQELQARFVPQPTDRSTALLFLKPGTQGTTVPASLIFRKVDASTGLPLQIEVLGVEEHDPRPVEAVVLDWLSRKAGWPAETNAIRPRASPSERSASRRVDEPRTTDAPRAWIAASRGSSREVDTLRQKLTAFGVSVEPTRLSSTSRSPEDQTDVVGCPSLFYLWNNPVREAADVEEDLARAVISGFPIVIVQAPLMARQNPCGDLLDDLPALQLEEIDDAALGSLFSRKEQGGRWEHADRLRTAVFEILDLTRNGVPPDRLFHHVFSQTDVSMLRTARWLLSRFNVDGFDKARLADARDLVDLRVKAIDVRSANEIGHLIDALHEAGRALREKGAEPETISGLVSRLVGAWASGVFSRPTLPILASSSTATPRPKKRTIHCHICSGTFAPDRHSRCATCGLPHQAWSELSGHETKEKG